MDEKKSFFELLSPKSALVVGLVGGLLSLGTIGFVVLSGLLLRGSLSFGVGTNLATVPATQQQAIQPVVADATPPSVLPKTDKPKVELFVMSYCPFGLQMEKAYLPAWQLLKNKADIDVKFVNYAMHGKKEVDENTRQYCIEKQQPTKYAAYLQCFFGAGTNDGSEANYKQCLTEAGISDSVVNACMSATDKKFAITKKFDDQSSWLNGRYPQYPIHSELNTQYGVQGSPTLIINGQEAKVNRTAEAVKQAICAAFTNPPAECAQTLPSVAYQAGFGLQTTADGAGTAQPGCGT